MKHDGRVMRDPMPLALLSQLGAEVVLSAPPSVEDCSAHFEPSTAVL